MANIPLPPPPPNPPLPPFITRIPDVLPDAPVHVFQQFTADDVILNNVQYVTEGMFKDGDPNLIKGELHYDINEFPEYYLKIYRKDPNNPATDPRDNRVEFHVAYGHRLGWGAPANQDYFYDNTPTKAIYSQMANLLLPPDDTVFNFKDGEASDEIFVITFPRESVKDKIDPGNFEIYIGLPYPKLLVDDSQASYSVNAGANLRVLNLVEGENIDGLRKPKPDSRGYGLVYPDLGIIILNAKAIREELDKDFNRLITGTQSFAVSTLLPGNFSMLIVSGSQPPISGEFFIAPSNSSYFNTLHNKRMVVLDNFAGVLKDGFCFNAQISLDSTSSFVTSTTVENLRFNGMLSGSFTGYFVGKAYQGSVLNITGQTNYVNQTVTSSNGAIVNGYGTINGVFVGLYRGHALNATTLLYSGAGTITGNIELLDFQSFIGEISERTLFMDQSNGNYAIFNDVPVKYLPPLFPIGSYTNFNIHFFNFLLESFNRGGYFLFRNERQVNVSHYFIRIKNRDFNYSNNPTYIKNSKGEFYHEDFYREPRTYITTIGLYNERYELLAVAKLSKPLEKSFDKEHLIRVNLQY